MKPEELMIGNYVSNGEKIYQVDGNMIYDSWAKLATFYPIPLDEQWLLDFGFVSTTELAIYRKEIVDGYELVVMLSKGSIFVELHMYHDEHEFLNLPVDLKYVHALQNLYFALTGQKLTKK